MKPPVREMYDYLECPCCGDVATEPVRDGPGFAVYYYDGMDMICGCKGLSVSCDAETPPYISGDCIVDHEF